MKRLLPALLAILLMLNSAAATILPAAGVDEDFKAWTGIECTPAVILCQSLSVYDNRGDQGGKKVDTLNYTGKDIPVIESWDGWARIYYSDGTKTGWVRNDYLLMDPAWYVCDEDMQVYAYPDVMAPRVALLDAGTKLPILTEYEDAESIAGWVCVSLRGAAGWIRKTPADTADQTWFRPEMIRDVVWAELDCGSVSLTCTDPAALQALTELITHVQDTGGMTASCPFTVSLKVERADGQQIRLQLATDSCCVYRVDGRDYQYARHLWNEREGSPDNTVLFSLFGVNPQENNLHAAMPVNAYCFTDVLLYRNPGDAEAFAVLPKLTEIWWRSSTEDRAFGYVEANLDGERLRGYAPWDSLQTFEDGTESARALAALQAHMGWSQSEVEAYQLYTPVMKQQNQFLCVTVMSATEPQWRFHVWLDQLTGGVYSITWE